jgi:serine/threonine protein kinase
MLLLLCHSSIGTELLTKTPNQRTSFLMPVGVRNSLILVFKGSETSDDQAKWRTLVSLSSELLKGGSFDTQKADIWSLGMDFYTIVTSKFPSTCGSDSQTVQLIKAGKLMYLNGMDAEERPTSNDLLADSFSMICCLMELDGMPTTCCSVVLMSRCSIGYGNSHLRYKHRFIFNLAYVLSDTSRENSSSPAKIQRAR